MKEITLTHPGQDVLPPIHRPNYHNWRNDPDVLPFPTLRAEAANNPKIAKVLDCLATAAEGAFCLGYLEGQVDSVRAIRAEMVRTMELGSIQDAERVVVHMPVLMPEVPPSAMEVKW